jgi:putative SOS response-associated peptidase YedK
VRRVTGSTGSFDRGGQPAEYHPGVCSNYVPVTSYDRLLKYFGVQRAKDEGPIETWPTGTAPFITPGPPGGPGRIVRDGLFGLVPSFASEKTYGRRTYNARSETVDRLPSFRESWRKGWRCIIPADAIYEPNWETGRPVRWRIQLQGAVPMGIAGIYRLAKLEDGTEAWTFAMLTVNADGHPVMQRFHKPQDEKRMVVVLQPGDYDLWLNCPVHEASAFFKRWEGPFEAWAVPLPPRTPKSPPSPSVEDLGLF